MCPHDGQVMPLIRYEISNQLDYVPPQVKVIVHKPTVHACPAKHDEAKLVTAPKPPQPIEKGLAGPGLLAQMVVGKFGDDLPGYRLEDVLSRHGVEIRRSTIYDWLASMAELVTPLVELMKQRVLQSNVIHTDDTQVKLIDKSLRSTRMARFSAYIGDTNHPATVYDFTESRQRVGPQQFLAGFEGSLHSGCLRRIRRDLCSSHAVRSSRLRVGRTVVATGGSRVSTMRPAHIMCWRWMVGFMNIELGGTKTRCRCSHAANATR